MDYFNLFANNEMKAIIPMQYAYYAFFDCSFWWFSLLFFIEGSIRFLSIVLTISSHTQRKPSRSETKVDGWHRTQNEFLLLMRHFIQQSGASKPLDVTVYGAVKAMYKKAHGRWMKTNASSVMQIMHIPKLVREACSNNKHAATMSRPISRFDKRSCSLQLPTSHFWKHNISHEKSGTIFFRIGHCTAADEEWEKQLYNCFPQQYMYVNVRLGWYPGLPYEW